MRRWGITTGRPTRTGRGLAVVLASIAVTAVAARDPSRTGDLNGVMGLRGSEVQPVRLDWTPGQPLEAVLRWRGRSLTLALTPHSPRSTRYTVLEVTPDGRTRAIAPGPVNTLRGTVAGDPASRVTAAIVAGGLHARIETGGEILWVEPAAPHLAPPPPQASPPPPQASPPPETHRRARPADAAPLHVVYSDEDVVSRPGLCGTNDKLVIDEAVAARGARSGPGVAGDDTVYIAELGCDADFEYVQRWGEATEARINAIVDQVNVQFERDVAITHEIVAIVVRTQPTYSSTDAGVLLNQLRSRWLIHHGDIGRDVTHLFSGKNLGQGVIGIAWVGRICDSLIDGFGFGLVESDFNGNFACVTDLTAHELGHNWDASHCSCPDHTMHPFITCANQFSQESIDGIIAHRDTRVCLEIVTEGYCAATSDDADDDHVAHVRLAAIDHPSGPSTYSDFTGVTTDLGRGTSHAVTVTLGGPRFPSDIGGLWIDWNADQDFDDEGETITAAWTGVGPYAGTVDVPATAPLGPTRLRLRIQDRQFDPELLPCGTTLQGEVEDYTVVVTEPCPGDVDGSRVVDFGDVLAILAVWGRCDRCPEDVDGSGVVDFGDILPVLAEWGPCP